VPPVRITQDDAADELLGRDPLALVLGMLFDQHMRQRSSGAVGRSACAGRYADGAQWAPRGEADV
jgi:hypothetical protein